MSYSSRGGLLAISAVCFLAGCSGPGYQRAEERVESIQHMRESIDKGKAQIQATLASLEQVVGTANTDPRPAFNKFTSDLATLDSMRETARSRAAALRSRSKEFFAAWEKEVAETKNPELRQISEERRNAARQELETLEKESQGLKTAYEAFSSDVHDIHNYFASNLNAAGIAAASATVAKTRESGNKVSQELDRFSAQLAAVADALAPAKKQG